jgi:hypothetical protein
MKYWNTIFMSALVGFFMLPLGIGFTAIALTGEVKHVEEYSNLDQYEPSITLLFGILCLSIFIGVFLLSYYEDKNYKAPRLDCFKNTLEPKSNGDQT